MRAVFLIPLVLLACKGGKDEDTDPPDCNAETTTPLSTLAVSDWPAGMTEAVEAYNALSGIWTAEACGTPIRVTITTEANTGTVDVVESGLPAGHSCGCTFDPTNPDDGNLNVIGYSTVDISVQDYPRPEFSEENAGNVPGVVVTLLDGTNGIRVRACDQHLVPPILGSDFTDTNLIITNGDSGIAGSATLVGDNLTPDGCPLTGWTRVSDAN